MDSFLAKQQQPSPRLRPRSIVALWPFRFASRTPVDRVSRRSREAVQNQVRAPGLHGDRDVHTMEAAELSVRGKHSLEALQTMRSRGIGFIDATAVSIQTISHQLLPIRLFRAQESCQSGAADVVFSLYELCVLSCSGSPLPFNLPWIVVISQTRWLVSQERLSPRAGTSVFIEYTVVPSMRQWF